MSTDKYWVFENIEDAALLIDKLQQQRDELLDACKQALNIIGFGKEYDAIKNAIAKVESEK